MKNNTRVTYSVSQRGNHFNGEFRIAGRAQTQTVLRKVRLHARRRGFTAGAKLSITATGRITPMLASDSVILGN